MARALRLIARGFEALATAIESDDSSPSRAERYLAALREWGSDGLDRNQTSALLCRHGFAPQAAGGWARGEWIETRNDGLRYLTKRSHDWVAEQSSQQQEARR